MRPTTSFSFSFGEASLRAPEEGAAVGLVVGWPLGTSVCRALGSPDGDDGTLLGWPEGRAVGPAVGCPVGDEGVCQSAVLTVDHWVRPRVGHLVLQWAGQRASLTAHHSAHLMVKRAHHWAVPMAVQWVHRLAGQKEKMVHHLVDSRADLRADL